MDEEIKNILIKCDDYSDLNFSGLIELIDNNKLPIKNCILKGPVGLTLNGNIYIDFIKFRNDYKMLYFTILHEMGHYLRLKKLNYDYALELYLKPDFNEFFNDVINEELFADKFANLMYFKLNGTSINKYQFTSKNDYRIDDYIDIIKPIFNYIKTKDDYNNFFNLIIK